jgi:hypothetical protein
MTIKETYPDDNEDLVIETMPMPDIDAVLTRIAGLAGSRLIRLVEGQASDISEATPEES